MTKSIDVHQHLQETSAFNQTITLPDGRTLGFAEYGTPDGYPIFYFHGGNGSRYEAKWFDHAAKTHKIRLVAPDRPGFGLSTFQPSRQIRDWSQDVQALADHLQINNFSIFGLSGGGPYVVALAHDIGERLNRSAIISGTAPPVAKNRFRDMWFPVRLIFFMAKHAPAINKRILQQMGSFYADSEKMRQTMLRGLPKPDVEFLTRVPEALDIFALDAQEAHRIGIEGDAYEWGLYVQDWGFEIADIADEVGLWYGKHDVQVPPAMGEYFANTLPRSQFHLVEDGGHFSTINNHIDDIFAYLSL